MGRRGRKRQLAVEDAYWQLIMAGVGTVEACQRVGITRKTGYRWRAERGGLPPLRVVEEERGPRYLSLLERRRIATLRRTGLAVRAIAQELGRCPSTVSRELRRNRRPHDVAATTASWRNTGQGSVRAGRGRVGWLETWRCRTWCRQSWSWSGARSRSRPGCA
jgi:transposase